MYRSDSSCLDDNKNLTLQKANEIIDFCNASERTKSDNYLLTLTNTKDINPSVVNCLAKQIKRRDLINIRVIGGLDASVNPKFNDPDMMTLNLYKPDELAGILSRFEQIEKDINPCDPPIVRAAQIYNTLARSVTYPEQPQDYESCRSLRGLLNNEMICAGYALLFKELMDRQGIECEYVHGEKHAWNNLKIDGQWYPIDLTWGAEEIQKNPNHVYTDFASDPKFYSYENHALENKTTARPVLCFSKEQIELVNHALAGKAVFATASSQKKALSGQLAEQIACTNKDYSF